MFDQFISTYHFAPKQADYPQWETMREAPAASTAAERAAWTQLFASDMIFYYMRILSLIFLFLEEIQRISLNFSLLFALHGVTLPLALFIFVREAVQVQLEIGSLILLHVLLRSTGVWELRPSEAFAARRKLLLLASFFQFLTLRAFLFGPTFACLSLSLSLCFIAAFALRFATFHILFTVNYVAKICRSLKMRCGIVSWG